LRIEHEFTPFNENFVIFDTEEQVTAVSQAVGELDLDPKKFPPRRILHAISSAKNELRLPHQYIASDYFTEVVARVYPRYQSILLDNNALDFDDLLVQMVILLQKHPVVREKYQQRFEYVLVDEFQDTNTVQYQLVKLWGAPQQNIFAVGDEDQSIYAFRGADFRNVLRFREDFKDAQVVLLEQNYRSTQIVLDVARAIIDRNQQRTPKALFTDRQGGERVSIHEAFDDNYEARYVTDQVNRLKKQGYTYNQMAVMYRTNTQSRAVEDAFIKEGIPYTLVGGVGFYKRREVKDLIAYLRVLHNPDDKFSFARIINVPKRGIGEKSLHEFQQTANTHHWTQLELLERLVRGEKINLAARSAKLFTEFGKQLLAWRKLMINGQLVQLFDTLIADIGYNRHLYDTSDTPEQANERIDNLRELRGLLLRADEDQIPLGEWLNDQSLMTDAEEPTIEQDKVTLLTLHAAKGLEYPIVFITGLEEGLLPHSRSFEEAGGIDEERRLFYVGITRAKDKLYLTYAFRRTLWGSSDVRDISRFLNDIPEALIASVPDRLSGERTSQGYSSQTRWDSSSGSSGSGLDRLKRDLQHFKQQNPAPPSMPPLPLKPVPPKPQGESNAAIRSKILPFPVPGRKNETQRHAPQQRVKHPLFGVGTVQASVFEGGDELVTVKFDDPRYGEKRLMASIANMTIL
jgi:DNA helicase-2/ATP-dependent DNA helicase PcrA